MTLLSSQSSSKSAPSPNAHQGEEGLSTAWSTASWEGRRGEVCLLCLLRLCGSKSSLGGGSDFCFGALQA